MSVNIADLEVIAEQLEREPWGVVDISYRSPDSIPGMVKTRPRLDDDTPFPTLFYLIDPQLTAEAPRLETTGVMKEMTARLESDAELTTDYQRAHETFLAERNEMEDLGTDFSGGDMLMRVKCLHVLIVYALVKGPDHFRLGTGSVALVAESEKLHGAAIPISWPTVTELGIVYPGVEG